MKRFVCLLLVAAIGCQRPKETPKEPTEDLGPEYPTTLDVTYAGRDAKYWGEKLLIQDRTTSPMPEDAPKKIGEESIRFCVKALESPNSSDRWGAAFALPLTECRPYKKRLVPLLTKVLKEDPDPITRWFLVKNILKSRFTPMFDVLRERESKDPTEMVRKEIAEGLARIGGDRR